ncbi:hypothetical protein DQG23_04095 [Paenibacillus contaminans]|uniref:Uncharacterized protein n=1 Tax=Paenibacillus contaminans TaxID=450362 RepID=A0A329MUL8_9BACL|nr:hypothetical protein DQG23_04095 [Paenibacillus contaminans]
MTVKGPVSLRWERAGSGFTASISLPNGVAATLVPPLDLWRVKAITIDGQAEIGAYVEHAPTGMCPWRRAAGMSLRLPHPFKNNQCSMLRFYIFFLIISLRVWKRVYSAIHYF